jgi:hypothetical protein
VTFVIVVVVPRPKSGLRPDFGAGNRLEFLLIGSGRERRFRRLSGGDCAHPKDHPSAS